MTIRLKFISYSYVYPDPLDKKALQKKQTNKNEQIHATLWKKKKI